MSREKANDKPNRATGLLVIEVVNSNPNGDPDRESDPRQRPDSRGEISPVSFKRKLRDLVEEKQGPVWETLTCGTQAGGRSVRDPRKSRTRPQGHRERTEGWNLP